ncbi:ATP-dependent nuclease [Rhodovulum sulfidophilum]|uniref:AAA family ATPase n=1 Tax=Rhodovulum sulfidophilum TaxID=35806 RepID=A0ABS1RYF6_RHOSU|nr:ATP-binding protein [Rhodovulum sulfidophilum]MBL3611133.1 AAA family ATPase [Rhodovulum sulfidophilum]MCE8456903.1 AAA family ATPase [Rhodovulum sulfidophilum]
MSRVKSIDFFDYKTFSRFTVSARAKNILVGPNNAGKSTVLDAFRISFDALRYASRRSAHLKSQGDDGVCSTWEVPVSAVQTDMRYCIHNFGDGRARISIKLENGNSFVIAAPNDGPLECYLKTELQPQKNTKFLRDQFPLSLMIVPTLSPLEQNEELVQQETVERNRYGRLASRNFRNFWLHKTEAEFEAFADLVELGWPGIRVRRPEIERGGQRPVVRMYFRDGPHVREVQWAGFGFQVWMQTMMHLSTSNHTSTLILDEPDIYLHPDLQHRLLRLVGQRVGQYFIATHSTEIINDVEPGEVLILRPGSRSAKRIQGEAGYSDVYSAIGSSENAQFARLAKTKKVLYFEGKDAKILSKIAKKLGGMDFISNSSVTLMKTDGFTNWTRVTTSSWVFENFFGFKIPVSAIFDRDYRCDEEINAFMADVNVGDTLCRVLPRKEIENLLLVPEAIVAVVKKFGRNQLQDDWKEVVLGAIDDSVDEVKSKTLSARIGARIAYEVGKGSRKDIATISAEEEAIFTSCWEKLDFRYRVIPGKSVFSAITKRIQEKLKVTVTSSRVIDEMTAADMPPELFEILKDVKRHLDA